MQIEQDQALSAIVDGALAVELAPRQQPARMGRL
jgi:hypothetical protein